MNAARSFTVSHDRTTKIVTGVVNIVLIGLMLAFHNVIVVLGPLAILIAFAYSTLGYTVDERSIVVRRMIGNVRIPIDSIREIRTATPDDLRFCIRLWGSGGWFGYYGLFRTAGLGRCTWYVTNRSHMVVLITASKTCLFSPDDVEGFLAAVRGNAPASAGGAVPAMSARAVWVVSFAIGLAVAAAVLTAAILGVRSLGYDPGPPPYDLNAGALAIHDRFYPLTIGAASTDVAGVRTVDLNQEPGWRPVLRVGGFGNGRYQSGWFRAANGTKMRLYRATTEERLILLPAKDGGAPVLLQVADPDQFGEQLRREWSGR